MVYGLIYIYKNLYKLPRGEAYFCLGCCFPRILTFLFGNKKTNISSELHKFMNKLHMTQEKGYTCS